MWRSNKSEKTLIFFQTLLFPIHHFVQNHLPEVTDRMTFRKMERKRRSESFCTLCHLLWMCADATNTGRFGDEMFRRCIEWLGEIIIMPVLGRWSLCGSTLTCLSSLRCTEICLRMDVKQQTTENLFALY
jgi:hypothetical protein